MSLLPNETTTHMDIGLSKEDLERIEALRFHEEKPKITKKGEGILQKLNRFAVSLTRIKLRDKVTFFQLLGVMIHSGMPIIRSLYVLAEQTTNPRMKEVVRTLALKMEEGKSFSNSMRLFPTIFTEAEIGMVASGEASGQLYSILKDVSIQEEKASAVLSKVKGAMIYPAVVLAIMVISAFLMLTLVVPKLVALFEEGQKELPTATKLLLAMSDFAVHKWKLLLLGLLIVIGLIYLISHNKKGRYILDTLVLHIPFFGKILKEVMVARFARTLSSLIHAGIPIVRALDITSNAVSNSVYRRRISFAAQDVAQGIPLGENLMNSEALFPPMVASMVSIGEKTANMAEVSGKIADYYEEQIDIRVNTLSRLIEPIVLLFMGAMVAFLVAAIMGPIISLTDLVTTL